MPKDVILTREGLANLKAELEVLSTTRRMAEIIAHHSKRDVEQVMRDIDRDKFMSPSEAVDYGLIDDVIAPRRAA